jgi:hypothetical protein
MKEREVGGTLDGHGEGRDKGARFVLELPVTRHTGELDAAAVATSSSPPVGPPP